MPLVWNRNPAASAGDDTARVAGHGDVVGQHRLAGFAGLSEARYAGEARCGLEAIRRQAKTDRFLK